VPHEQAQDSTQDANRTGRSHADREAIAGEADHHRTPPEVGGHAPERRIEADSHGEHAPARLGGAAP
jgi:hypothetical protein